jgi:hypothetical protein
MPMLFPMAQGSPGDLIAPVFVPCCGAVLLIIALAVFAIATAHYHAPDETAPEGGGRPSMVGTAGVVLDYAEPGRPGRRRRALVFHPRLWPIVFGAVIIYVGLAYAYVQWDYRTRTTLVRLVDASTGKPVTIAPSDAFADGNCPGFEEAITYPVPGTARVSWDHPCVVVFQIPGYSETSPNGTFELDDDTPPVVTLRMRR